LAQARLQLLLVVLGGAALSLLAVGLALMWSGPFGPALALIGAEYAIRFATGPRALDEWTPLYAGGLVLAAELAYWSSERRIAVDAEPVAVAWQVWSLVGVGGGGAVVAALVLLAAGVPVEGGVGLEAIGVAAAALVYALAAVAAVRLRTRSTL
jgi:hypothetical protein